MDWDVNHGLELPQALLRLLDQVEVLLAFTFLLMLSLTMGV
jgi:hypothetical protein